ncbi:MAG: hypothetical protein ABIE70_01995 [bacterium]
MKTPTRSIGFVLILCTAVVIWFSVTAPGGDITFTELWQFDSGG